MYYFLSVSKVTTTIKYQVLDGICKYSTLLVLSPKHGQISYIWEYRVDELTYWETIAVPSHTCLLYVKDFGEYKCTIGDSENVHLFTVACRVHICL